MDRFGVDLKRNLAFMPNDAPGWTRRVIWTLDIKDPLKPEVVKLLQETAAHNVKQAART